MSNFHPLEVVCRGSGTQLQAGEKIKLFVLAAEGLMLNDGYLIVPFDLSAITPSSYCFKDNTKYRPA